MLGLSFSSKVGWGFYIVSIAKNSFKKIGAFIHFMKFFSDEVSNMFLTWSFCKSSIWPCIEYCSQIWLGAPSYYSDIIDELQKHLCRTVGPTPAVFLSSEKCNQLKFFLLVLLWYMFHWTGWTTAASFFC